MMPLTSPVFEKQYPGITVKFATYAEGDLRVAIESLMPAALHASRRYWQTSGRGRILCFAGGMDLSQTTRTMLFAWS